MHLKQLLVAKTKEMDEDDHGVKEDAAGGKNASFKSASVSHSVLCRISIHASIYILLSLVDSTIPSLTILIHVCLNTLQSNEMVSQPKKEYMIWLCRYYTAEAKRRYTTEAKR